MRTMNKPRELRIKYNEYDKCTMWNEAKVCARCVKDNESKIAQNNNNVENEDNKAGEMNSKANNQQKRKRNKADRIRVKGVVESEKGEGVVRIFSVKCNGLGPHAKGKLDQIIDASKNRKIDGLLISSSDVRWTEYDKEKIKCDLKKNINKNVMLNASDSGEEVMDGRWFLREGTATALWINVAKHVEVESTCAEENGWQNAVMLTGGGKESSNDNSV